MKKILIFSFVTLFTTSLSFATEKKISKKELQKACTECLTEHTEAYCKEQISSSCKPMSDEEAGAFSRACDAQASLDAANYRLDFQKQMQRDYGVFKKDEMYQWAQRKIVATNYLKEQSAPYERASHKKFNRLECPKTPNNLDAQITASLGEISEENISSKLCNFLGQEQQLKNMVNEQRKIIKEAGVFDKMALYDAGSGELEMRQTIKVIKDFYNKQFKKMFNPKSCK